MCMDPMPEPTVAAVVLAAGEGHRFGAIKQIASFRGRPLLQYAIDAATGSRAGHVFVVLGANREEVADAVEFGRATPVDCPDWKLGQSASLRAGIEAVQNFDAAVVMLGDQPDVTAAAVDRVMNAREANRHAVRATYEGVPGHPVLFENDLFGALRKLSGDRGARDLLRTASVVEVACDGLGSLRDVDTRDDLESLAERPA